MLSVMILLPVLVAVLVVQRVVRQAELRVAQLVVPQVLFGALPGRGKLPVTVSPTMAPIDPARSLPNTMPGNSSSDGGVR